MRKSYFNNTQVKKFVYNWYLATTILSYAKDDPGLRQEAEQKAHDLLDRLRKNPVLHELTVNPLLLTMIAMVHSYRDALPGRRVELYAEICDVLLGHWRQAKGLTDPLTAAQKRAVLQPLAADMMQQRVRSIAIPDALKVMTPLLKQVGVVDHEIPLFLNELQVSSGLVLESEPDMWSFAHLTFQEYLCAAHWQETGEAVIWDMACWNKLVNESWWHETLRLYAALGDATPIAQTCLELNTITALALAIDLREEARKFDTTMREAITARIEGNLESTDPEIRRWAAEVQLARRLSQRT